MLPVLVDSEVACLWAQFSGANENLTGSGSEIAVSLNTAKKQCFAAPPLKDSGSSRLPGAAPRRILRCVHEGNETVSSRRPKPPELSRTRQHEMRPKIPARASWRLQRARWRGLASIGIRRRLELLRERAVAISSLTNFVNSASLLKHGHQQSHPLRCRGNCRTQWR